MSVSAEDAGQAGRLIADYRVGDGVNPGVRIRDEFDALEAAIECGSAIAACWSMPSHIDRARGA